MPEVNGDGYSVECSVPTGVNRPPRSSGTPGQRMARPLVGTPFANERDLGGQGERQGQPSG